MRAEFCHGDCWRENLRRCGSNPGGKKMSFRRAAALFYSKLLISVSISFTFTRGLTLCVTGTGGLILVKYTVPGKR